MANAYFCPGSSGGAPVVGVAKGLGAAGSAACDFIEVMGKGAGEAGGKSLAPVGRLG